MSFVVGDNGVLTQAQKAKIRTDKESAEEEVKLEVAGSYDDEGNLDLGLLNANLENNLKGIKLKVKKDEVGEGEEEYEYLELGKDHNGKNIEIESLPATVYYKQNEVTINGKEKLLSDVASNPENYGMYVDYPIKLSGNEDTINDWRIFYEDKTGMVFLIAADYVPNTCEALKKEKGKETLIAGMTQDDKCRYSWSKSKVPSYTCNDGHNSLNQSKSQCSFPDIFMPDVDECHGHYYCSEHTGNYNSKCVSQLQCTGEWSGFVDSKYAEYAIGGPTIEMWLGSWNSHTDKEKYEKLEYNSSDSYGYAYVYGTIGNTASVHSITTPDGKKDTLYFPHPDSGNSLDLFDDEYDSINKTDGSESAYCQSYWLASPIYRYNTYECLMQVKYDGSLLGYFYYSGNGIRPIVSLKSGIYVEVQEDVTNEDGTVIKSCRLVK